MKPYSYKNIHKNPVSHSSGVLASLFENIVIKHPLKYLAVPGVIFVIIGIFFAISVVAIFSDFRYFSIPSTIISVGFLIIGSLLNQKKKIIFIYFYIHLNL